MTADAPALRYKIGPLDTLNVVVWRNPELSTQVTVRPDGYISTPLVDDLLAAGKNPSDLAREVERALSKVLRDPVVSVVVSVGSVVPVVSATSARSSGHPVTVRASRAGAAAGTYRMFKSNPPATRITSGAPCRTRRGPPCDAVGRAAALGRSRGSRAPDGE